MSKPAVEQMPSSTELEETDSLSQYGMAVDPFSDDAFRHVEDGINPFFIGGDRRSVLDEVAHLCQFNNNLVAVLGEAGVGKTALVQQVLIELQETAQCCLIQSSVMATIEDVFQQLASHLGVFIEPDASIDQMLAVVAQYNPSGLQQRVVVVVDDAHHLNDLVLSALIRLLQEQSGYYLHVLLVGDSSLLLRLDQLDKGEILAYDIPLCPFTAEELEQYLTFKLSVVGYQGAELFDMEAVQSIWRDTRGIPSSVNRAARQMLLNHTMAQEEERSLGLPIWHMAMVVVLLAALIMAVFYVGNDDVDPSGVVSSEAVASPELGAEAVKELAKPESVSSAQEVLVKPEVSEPPVEELAPKKQSDISDKAGETAARLSQVQEREAVIEKPPVVQSATQPQSQPQVNTQVQPSAQTVEVQKQQVPQPVVAPRPQPSPSSGLLTQDEQVVMLWPSESYTLQVMAAGQLAGIEKFVAQQSNKNRLRIVTIARNGQPWYVVLTGNYSGLVEARQAISTLPEQQSRAKPWPRKIDAIKQQINDFRRK